MEHKRKLYTPVGVTWEGIQLSDEDMDRLKAGKVILIPLGQGKDTVFVAYDNDDECFNRYIDAVKYNEMWRR